MLNHVAYLAEVSAEAVIWFSLGVLGAFFLLFGAFWFSWWLRNRPASLSPYTGTPLRLASQLSYYSIERTLRFLYEMQDYENRIFDLRQATFCRETGRIFPNSITWYNAISVDWDFLQKRYPGKYVSWGSLTKDQQQDIRELHESLEGFQTEESSTSATPRAVEPYFALLKPGPLYVDVETHVVLGWKCVPQTNMEVLIVQKPKTPLSYTPIQEIT